VIQNNWLNNSHTDAGKYLNNVCETLPVVKKIIEKYGNISLSDYINNFISVPQPALQPRNDLNQAVFQYIKPLLGESIAKRVVNDISISPVVLTTNHHGINYFANSIQGNLIFGAAAFTGRSSRTTIPLFSCGNIPLNNATYPRGVLLYNANYKTLQEMPLRLSLYPKRYREIMVSYTSAFNLKMIADFKKRIDKMFREKKISLNVLKVLNTVLDEDYCDQSVINQDSYSKQSVLVNNRLWKRMFSTNNEVPELVYIEMEKIVTTLLQHDLANPDSLVMRVLFDTSAKNHLLNVLDGIRGCWNQKNLEKLFKSTVKTISYETGTVFFWGIDEFGRRIPLYTETDSNGNEFLCGKDYYRNIWKISYHTDAIMKGLYEKTIIPSTFTCFLTLSFARGLVCIGGDFQGEYLAQMQTAVASVLKKAGDEETARMVEKVKTDTYLDGMLVFMCPFKEKFLVPAGPIEIIGSRGITKEDMEKALNLNIRDAHIAGLFETLKDSGGDKLYDSDWKKNIARDCCDLLNEKIVIKYPDN